MESGLGSGRHLRTGACDCRDVLDSLGLVFLERVVVYKRGDDARAA
jgi:hypothetical protein